MAIPRSVIRKRGFGRCLQTYWHPALLFFVVLALTATGCAKPEVTKPPRPASTTDPILYESRNLRIAFLGYVGAGSEGTLVKDPGWSEYVIEAKNLGRRPLVVRNVKLLDRNGRYLDSASSYEEITAPPDAAYELAGSIAKSAAGTVAGQVIPYGGYLVRIFSGAAAASAAEGRQSAKRAFALRVLKNVELAPAGRVTGSAFLPNIANSKALTIDYEAGGTKERIEIPLQ